MTDTTELIDLAEWEDPRVQLVYKILCDDVRPSDDDEHWEGFVARRIVAALSLPSSGEVVALREALKPFAEAAANIDDNEPDHREMWEHPASMSLTVSDFRRAARATESGK